MGTATLSLVMICAQALDVYRTVDAASTAPAVPPAMMETAVGTLPEPWHGALSAQHEHVYDEQAYMSS